jgi:hypothetical protein
MDSKILSLVIEDMRRRELVGKSKYGTTMDRVDLTTGQWVTNLKEELQDAILYLTKLEQIHNAPQEDLQLREYLR